MTTNLGSHIIERESGIESKSGKKRSNIHIDTNWKPEFSGYSGFKKALLETYDWFKDSENISFYKNTSKYHI